jgi:GT2 family glycosyltransferase
MLRRSLKAINASDYPRTSFEIIVVDNGSTDGTGDLKREFPDVRWLVENVVGKSNALNTGCKAARGSILAFTDDDCIVDSEWLRNLVSAFFDEPSVIGVGGSCYVADSETINDKLFSKKVQGLGIVDFGKKTKFVDELIGGNFAFKRQAFDVAKFDKRLGRRGTLSLGGEDSDFCHQLRSKGYQLLYTPHAFVYHMLPPSRRAPLNLIRGSMQGSISYVISILKWRCASSRIPRIKALRIILGRLLDDFLTFLKVRSFFACCELVNRITAIVVCITFLDTIY